MPNLKQLLALKAKYLDQTRAFTMYDQQPINKLFEGFNPNHCRKGFNFTAIQHTRHFAHVTNFESHVEFFEKRQKVKAVLLFIDITSFSTKFSSKTDKEIVDYLDSYYKKAIPIISKYGGEVEKIMGDGIICIFGPPFLNQPLESLHTKAEQCAMDLIQSFKWTDYEVKIALHSGDIMYYKNDCDAYWEYTMIGNALTELFRLESVSHSNSINFFCSTYYDRHLQYNNIDSKYRPWRLSLPKTVSLTGVNFTSMRNLEKI